jgi:hypothetical protein
VIRLWHRIGVFRILSVGLLVLGVVAASYLSVGRQSQQRVNQAAQTSQSEKDELNELRVAMQERERVSAASRNAQREAQAKADAAAAEAAASAKAAEDAARKAQPPTTPRTSTSSSPAKPPPPFGPVPSSCAEYTGNQAIGCALMLEAGFGLDQMTCLSKLWQKESGWNVKARNPSGAVGIPQAMPGKKMAAYGADWETNPVPQIKWGLNYIKTKYQKPCGAWSTWQSKGWY